MNLFLELKECSSKEVKNVISKIEKIIKFSEALTVRLDFYKISYVFTICKYENIYILSMNLYEILDDSYVYINKHTHPLFYDMDFYEKLFDVNGNHRKNYNSLEEIYKDLYDYIFMFYKLGENLIFQWKQKNLV